MQKGEPIIVSPVDLVAGGEAMARVDGVPIFVANLYPGDVARVRVIEVKRGFARAELIELLKPSADRRAAPCPIAEECGGCDWTALRLDRQLEAKRRILVESLRRIGKIDPASLPPIAIHPSSLNYRIRSRLHGEGETIGFYAMRSNRVVPLSRECEVVGVETARVFGGHPDPERSEGEGSGGVGAATAASSQPLPTRSLAHAGDDIWEVNKRLIIRDEELEIRVNEFTYRLSTRAFFQVNRHLLGTLLRLVSAHAGRVTSKKTAIELYAGVGFFTLPLARAFERVIAVEGSRELARYAKRNVPPNTKVIRAPVEEWIGRMGEADFIFFDPPRAGARKPVMKAISNHARRMVCYLSCDPVTFARDASRLIASGWRLSTLDLLDLFPNTHHVETLSSFERAPCLP